LQTSNRARSGTATTSIGTRSIFQETEKRDGEQSSCPECDNVHLVSDDIETFCPECGLVVDENLLNRGPNWTPFDADEKRHVGGQVTVTRHDRGISTNIGRYRDGNGQELSGDKRRQFSRLRRWNGRARFDSKGEKNLAHGLSEIKRIVGVLDLGESIRERASYLYREAQSNDLLPGRSIESMAAGAVYAACRQQRLPRYLDEVSDAAHVDTGKVRLAYQTLNRELELQVPPPLPVDYLPRIASEVDAPITVRERAWELCSSTTVEDLMCGRKPASVAAGCLYYAIQELDESGSILQADIAEAAGVTAVSLRAVWQTLEEHSLASDLTSSVDSTPGKPENSA